LNIRKELKEEREDELMRLHNERMSTSKTK
jgi:hypothetical protein